MSRFREEIGEQPLLASRLLAESRAAVAAIATRVRGSKSRGFVIAARGSSDHAALYAKYLFGVRNRMMVTLAAPSLFTSYGGAPTRAAQRATALPPSRPAPHVLAQ